MVILQFPTQVIRNSQFLPFFAAAFSETINSPFGPIKAPLHAQGMVEGFWAAIRPAEWQMSRPYLPARATPCHVTESVGKTRNNGGSKGKSKGNCHG